MNDSTQKKLYHYTSTISFKNILACSALYMNAVINVRDEKEIPNMISAAKDTFEKSKGFSLSEDDINLIQKIRKHSYCACFSENANNEYLANNYGNSKEGLILVFDTKMATTSHSTIAFSDTVNKKNQFSEYAAIKKMQYLPYPYAQPAEFDIGIHYFYAAQYKDKQFEAEEEIRLYYHPGEDVKISLPSKAPVRDCVEYHPYKNLIHSLEFNKNQVYVYFDTPNKESSFYLSGIIRLEYCLISEASVNKILKEYGFDKVNIESRYPPTIIK